MINSKQGVVKSVVFLVLVLETGRYRGVLNVNRVCSFCKQDIEDKFHSILNYPIYQNLISKDIKLHYYTNNEWL